MSDFDQELKLLFLEEASQTATDLEQCLLALEADPNDVENLNKIFRLAHNLKGSSKAVGFDEVGSFTHEYESFILKIKNKELEASADVVSLLLRSCDHTTQMINGLKENLDAKFDSESLLNEMRSGQFGGSSNTENNTATENAPDDFLAATPEEVQPEVVSTPNAVEAPTAVVEALPVVEAGAPATEIKLDADPNSISPNLELLQELGLSLDLMVPPMAEPTSSNAIPTESAVPVAGASSNVLAQNSPLIHLVPDAIAVSVEFDPLKQIASSPVAAVAPTAPAENKKSEQAPPPSAPPAAGNKPAAKAPAVDDSIRVSIGKVENLLNYVGEMVILQSVLSEQVTNTNSVSLKRTSNQLEKISKEIQSLSMSLRMVPVKQTFQKMQRIVRDTAQALKKDVSITLAGEETEIDKTVLEKINDPLVHLIRNSVDHGIENAELRKQRGKSPKGQVFLSAYHQSGKLVIEVKDDGGGLDPEKLTKIAIAKGVLKAGTTLSKQEAQALIFAPGFSTKEQVTDVSGRGVGMDVVKTNILELSGEISIDSIVGEGTTFKIVLPLTLAIIDGMLINFSSERFIVPLAHVHETLRPAENQIQMTTGLGPVLILRGENLPVYNLGDFFGLKSKVASHEMIAMVIRSSGQPFALLVDDIIGQLQVVVKQLGNELSNYRGVSGSTILGDGKPALIIEPQDLFKRKVSNRIQGVAV